MKKLVCLIGALFMLNSVDVAAQTVVKEKTEKTWNKKKKGAVIGGVAGAATGVLIGKGVKGAVVGGVVGAGAGYLYGRHKEKRNPTPKTKTKRVIKY